MPRWTVKQADEQREKVLLALEKDGGTIARKAGTTKYLAEKSKFPSKTGFTTFLGRMQRDGLISLTMGPGNRPLIYGISLASNGSKPTVETPAAQVVRPPSESPPDPVATTPEATVEATPAQVVPSQPVPESVSLVHLESRVVLMEERAAALAAEAADAMQVITFLKDPPAELDTSKVLRAERDSLAQQLRDMTRKATDREKDAVEATRRLKSVNEALGRANGEVTMANESLNRVLDARTKSGQQVRNMLPEGERKRVENIVKRQLARQPKKK